MALGPGPEKVIPAVDDTAARLGIDQRLPPGAGGRLGLSDLGGRDCRGGRDRVQPGGGRPAIHARILERPAAAFGADPHHVVRHGPG
ncbi:MAG: hypothetical protein MPJ25_01470, partial [Pirellulales bacterium]|nr:hypothetical protein [Pirellulales bacterium]